MESNSSDQRGSTAVATMTPDAASAESTRAQTVREARTRATSRTVDPR